MTQATPEEIKKALLVTLDLALKIKDNTMLKQVLDQGGDAQRTLWYGHTNYQMAVVDIAVSAGADLNASVDGSADGDTYLISAIKREMWNYAETYLDRGADPNVTSAGKTPLENIVAIVNKRTQQGDSVSNTHKALIARLVAALPAPATQPTEAASLKKEVVLRNPGVVFTDKAKSSVPKP